MAEGLSSKTPSGGDGDPHKASVTLNRVNQMLEEQSRRIAHAVHDEAGQLLAAVFIRLDQAARESPADCGACFQEIKQMLELIELQLREISHDLRPPVLDDLGLVPAIKSLIDRVSQRSGLAIRLTCSVSDRLPAHVETALYRIVQESLTNTFKHASARDVDILINQEGEVVECCIRDDGVGFDLDEVQERKGSRGLGLVGIRERVESVGGTLAIQSRPGLGTTLVINIPWGTKNANRSTACG